MASPYSDMLRFAKTAADQQRLRRYDYAEYAIDVVVTSVVQEFGMAIARASDGDVELHLQDSTPGVRLCDLHVGQKLRVSVQGVLAPKVLAASLAP